MKTYEIHRESRVYYLCHIDDTHTTVQIGSKKIFASSSSIPSTLTFDKENLENLIIRYISNIWMLSNYAHRRYFSSGFGDGIRYAIDNMNAILNWEGTLFAEVETEEISINGEFVEIPKIRNGHINIINVKR